MSTRNPATAYFGAAGVVVGLALNESFKCVSVLASIPNKTTTMFRLSCVACVVVVVGVLLDFLFLDYSSSPFMVSNEYIGYLTFANYGLNWCSTLCITTLFMMRINVFYGAKSGVFRFMAFLAICLFSIKAVADSLLMKVSYDLSQWTYGGSVTADPSYQTGVFLMAFVALTECTFTATGSVAFLLYLTNTNTGSSDVTNGGGWNNIRDQVFKQEGVRLTMIVCCHMLIAYFAVLVAFADNYVAHVGFFMPALAYTMELHTFLDLSYNSTREILQKVQQSIANNNTQRGLTSTMSKNGKGGGGSVTKYQTQSIQESAKAPFASNKHFPSNQTSNATYNNGNGGYTTGNGQAVYSNNTRRKNSPQ